MPRVTMPVPANMTDAQRRVYESAVSGLRGNAPAPLIAWLNSPELADRAQKLGEFVRYRTELPARLSELAILMTARFWTAHYEWSVHKPEALKAGLSPLVIDEIAHRRPPRFEKDDERIVYDFVENLLNRRLIPANIYESTVVMLGERAVVELVGLLGYYALISMTINCFEIDVPEGTPIELDL